MKTFFYIIILSAVIPFFIACSEYSRFAYIANVRNRS